MIHSSALAWLLLATISLVDCNSPAAPEVVTPAPGTEGALAARTLDVVARDTPAARAATAEVARLDSLEVQSFLADDPATLARLWSDDFVVTNPFNQFVTKEQVLTLVTSGVLAFESYDRQIEYARAYGDVVIVAGRETVVWADKMPLAGQTSRLRYTAVWVRHGNTWQEVARHANLILGGAPGGPPTIR